MNVFWSFIICFAMYSIIPMPMTEWTKERTKYCFCFFPLIGLLIGTLWYGMFLILGDFSSIFSAIILMLLSVIISGGIHLDGLIDTCDAMFSYGDKSKKLEILKDPRTGAFGVIGAIIYFFILFASYYELLIQNTKLIYFMPFVFILSRAVASLSMLSVKSAKSTGLGATFSSSSDTKVNKTVLCVWILLIFAVFLYLNFLFGIIVFAIISLFLLWFIKYINREFGGITGDLTGFIMMLIELILPFSLAIGGHFL